MIISASFIMDGFNKLSDISVAPISLNILIWCFENILCVLCIYFIFYFVFSCVPFHSCVDFIFNPAVKPRYFQ